MLIRIIELIAFVLIISLLDARPALAGYIDPSSGGMLFQVLAVAFASLSGLILLFSGRIRMAWTRLKRSLNKPKQENEVQVENEVKNEVEKAN